MTFQSTLVLYNTSSISCMSEVSMCWKFISQMQLTRMLLQVRAYDHAISEMLGKNADNYHLQTWTAFHENSYEIFDTKSFLYLKLVNLFGVRQKFKVTFSNRFFQYTYALQYRQLIYKIAKFVMPGHYCVICRLVYARNTKIELKSRISVELGREKTSAPSPSSAFEILYPRKERWETVGRTW